MIVKTLTRVIRCRSEKLDRESLNTCRRTIENGGLVVFPTDTVYGVGCNAFNPVAVQKIYSLKGRRYTQPLPVLLGHKSQLPLVARDVPSETVPLLKSYWPGPLTLVFKTAPMALVVSRGRDTIAVRVPDHGVVRHILKSVQIPLAATSANTSGKPSVISGSDAIRMFDGRVELIIDGGECKWARESTIVDATHFPFTLLREGVISKSDLAKRLNLA
jgi:L-threonylcarbamoyladenylate synthase